MALDLKAIHEALADQIRAGIGSGWNVSAWPIEGQQLPSVEVWPGSPYIPEPLATFGRNGRSTINLVLRVRLSAANAETYGQQVSAVLSAGSGQSLSISDLVMEDKTLGGVVEQAVVVDPIEWAPSIDGDVVEIPVKVTTQKQGAQV